MEKGAIISSCNEYRYMLWRIWEPEKKLCMFIMLNPSTADAEKDDPTIRRCIDFAQRWGYGGICVGNLYGYRATHPEVLKQAADPIGPSNLTFVAEWAQKSAVIIAAWGNSSPWPTDAIKQKLAQRIGTSRVHCLKETKTGDPCHPLYLPKTCRPYPYFLNE